MHGIDPDQHIAYDVVAGYYIAALFPSTPETFPGSLAKALGPIGDGLIAVHSTQDGACGNGQHSRKLVTSPLGGDRGCGKRRWVKISFALLLT